MLGTETWFRPCDCGGPGWEKIAFYDFSQQECPSDFTRHKGQYNDASCRRTNECPTCSSLPLPVQGRSYSSVCGRVRGHGHGIAFNKAIASTCIEGLDQIYADGVSLTHGPAYRRRHIWTFAAAYADGDSDTSNTPVNCGCSNTNLNWNYATPEYVGNDYFCDSNRQFTDGSRRKDDDDDLWDGKGCGPSSSCCEWNDPPYFCKHFRYTTNEDLEIRLFSSSNILSVSLIEIFVM